MSLLQDQFVEIPINSGTSDDKLRGRLASVPEPLDSFILSPMGTPQFKKKKVNWVIDWMSKVSKKTDSFAHGVCEHGNCLEMVFSIESYGASLICSVFHAWRNFCFFTYREFTHQLHGTSPEDLVRILTIFHQNSLFGAPHGHISSYMIVDAIGMKLAPNLSQTMIGKLSLGARILQSGGVKNVFRKNFSVGERELLLKVCQCYLSTTAGPIAGLLFISTEKIAFHSERSLKLTSPSGVHRVPYKVLIPLRQISRADPTENAVRPTEKYIHIVTEDNSEFWFMGFVSYRKAFKCLQGAISQCKVNDPR